MTYRCRTEITAEILRSAMSGATRSKLMSESYLPFLSVKKYLACLQENQLLSYDQKTLLYRITENGIKFLQRYEEMSELFSQKENLEQRILNLVS